MERLERSLPRRFLRRWDLRFGSKVVSVVFAAICLVCCIAASVYCVELGRKDQSESVMRNSYAITLVAIIFCIVFMFACLALYRAIDRNNRPVILTWVLVALVWWAQAGLLCMIVTYMYRTETSCGIWLLYLLLGLIAFLILFYGISVVFAYWRQMQIIANQQYNPHQWKPPASGVASVASTPVTPTPPARAASPTASPARTSPTAAKK